MKVKLLYFFFSLAFFAVLARLFYWQVIKARELSDSARSQYQSGKKLTAPRGNILASDGTWLAARAEAWAVTAWIPDVKDINSVADSLAPLFLERDDEEFDEKSALLSEAGRIKTLLSRDASWVILKGGVSKEVKEEIEKKVLPGISFEPQESRVYPEGAAAAHILGFVGKDQEGANTGYFGLEGYYNLPLSGKPGFLEQEKDAAGMPILLGTSYEVSAIGGVDLLTHINKAIQTVVEKKLAEAIEKYGALSGSVIVMDPKTGAILASSSYPNYEPEKYFDYGNEFFKTTIVSDSLEPGSIFKVLVMAAGLDAEVVEPGTKCDICDGPIKIDEFEIGTWNRKYHPDSTMTDVIKNSDNVGMAYVAKKLGSQRLYEYLDKFGIGRKTEVDLQGEIGGTLAPYQDWTEADLVTISFGQGVATTPMQMVKAVSALANGGYEVTPQVVDKLVVGGWEEDIRPKIGPKVLSDEAVAEIRAMMVEAVKGGESKWESLARFRVAGKTGTAQIPVKGHYDEDKTNASYIGFAPAEDPKFVMLVTLREPQSSIWANATAAPLWDEIADYLFLHFGIQPSD